MINDPLVFCPLLLLLVLIAAACPASAVSTTRISIAGEGTQGNGESRAPAVSADGRFIAFASAASTLVSGDTNNRWDVFVRDRQAGTTERISATAAGVQGNDHSGMMGTGVYATYLGVAISGNGRYVAFGSRASNLVANDGNDDCDIFVRDRETGAVSRVSVSSAGAESNGDNFSPAISADGRYVAFLSYAENLVDGDTNNVADIFVHDRETHQTTRVSVSTSGAQAAGYSAGEPAISGDGRYVAFSSYSRFLVDSDSNGATDIFIRDRQANTTTRASVASDGAQGNGDSYTPALSGDGRYVAFISTAFNLVSGDTNARSDVFVRDRQTNTTTRVSVSTAGAQGLWDCNDRCALSTDGRYVAFASQAYNLVEEDTNGQYDVFVRDRTAGTTARMSVATAGAQGQGPGSEPAISGNGRCVAFSSTSANLVENDTNNYSDVFLRDWGVFQPDLLLRKWGETAYAGNGLYTLVTEQTRSVSTPTGVPIVFQLQAQNDGNVPDAFTIHGAAGGSGWTIRYYNAYTGGSLVTTPVTGTGWVTTPVPAGSTRYFRVEIIPGAGVVPGQVKEIQISAVSRADASKMDIVCIRAARVAPTAVTLTASPASPRPAGTAITLTASAAGGAPVQYQFWEGYVASGAWHWRVLRAYSTVATCPWTPAVARQYTIRVWARTVRSTQAYDQVRVIPYTVSQP